MPLAPTGSARAPVEAVSVWVDTLARSHDVHAHVLRGAGQSRRRKRRRVVALRPELEDREVVVALLAPWDRYMSGMLRHACRRCWTGRRVADDIAEVEHVEIGPGIWNTQVRHRVFGGCRVIVGGRHHDVSAIERQEEQDPRPPAPPQSP